jgi:hypothetical protein
VTAAERPNLLFQVPANAVMVPAVLEEPLSITMLLPIERKVALTLLKPYSKFPLAMLYPTVHKAVPDMKTWHPNPT